MIHRSPDSIRTENDDEIRSKRTATLNGVWQSIQQEQKFGLVHTRLDDIRLAKTVEEYLLKMKAIKARDKIQGKIQRHKVAGLMTSAIIHNQPLRAFRPDDFEGLDTWDPWGNQVLAIYHGVSLCADAAPEKSVLVFSENPQLSKWVQEFIALLRCGSPCDDSLIHIFGTLCFGFFPENFGVLD